MSKLLTSLLCLMFFGTSYAQIKDRFALSANLYGLPLANSSDPLGCMLNIGYEFHLFKGCNNIAIEPHIGGGLFGYKKTSGMYDEVAYSYLIGAWEVGVSPKYYLALDDNAYAFIANDFNLINMYGSINDQGTTSSRRVNKYMQFYYSCKVGILFNTDKYPLSAWIGYTTLNLVSVIDTRTMQYPNQRLGLCFGVSLMF